MISVASWNINSLRVRLSQVLEWTDTNRPDVLCLQETKIQDYDFPRESFSEIGYHAVFSGQQTYNGVAVISKKPITWLDTDLPFLENNEKRAICFEYASIRMLNLYVVNGEDIDTEKYIYKLRWLENLRFWLAQDIQSEKPYLLVGDFNIAPSEKDVFSHQIWSDKIIVSDRERQAFQAILDLGFIDCFNLFHHPKEKSYTWWDYRNNAFNLNHGLRIDLMLANTKLAGGCTFCSIDTSQRADPRPSDHTPLICKFERLLTSPW